ncbi:hypothetical protein [Paenibacillus lautus]|uniref:hypothetical protein n=1 Tax=Paenibacillus lautus TaxID=1401 RepID=UPI003D2C45EB
MVSVSTINGLLIGEITYLMSVGFGVERSADVLARRRRSFDAAAESPWPSLDQQRRVDQPPMLF